MQKNSFFTSFADLLGTVWVKLTFRAFWRRFHRRIPDRLGFSHCKDGSLTSHTSRFRYLVQVFISSDFALTITLILNSETKQKIHVVISNAQWPYVNSIKGEISVTKVSGSFPFFFQWLSLTTENSIFQNSYFFIWSKIHKK